jgi:MoxR-like ATPase
VTDIRALTEKVKQESLLVEEALAEMGRVIVGQRTLVERLLIGLLTNGHLLLEGVPGLAKTMAVRTLAGVLDARFSRVQFTPDLLPADLTGTLIYNPKDGAFSAKKGPLFANLVLADEINRAPAKVQSALLEAMQERQVTLGEQSFPLPDPFLVLATQNPVEQEGTYPLPEAQTDRFLMKVKVGYPTRGEEKEILERMGRLAPPAPRKALTLERVAAAREVVDGIYVDDKVKNYILDLVIATREPEKFRLERLKPWIGLGASPRATLALHKSAQAAAFLKGRAYVTPEDVKAVGADVLRHRLVLTYEAEAEEKTADDVIRLLFDEIPVP